MRASTCGSCRIAPSPWPAAAGPPSSIAAPRIRCLESGRGAPPGISSSGAPSISCTASARACSDTRGAAAGARAPLVLNPQGLEEFGATDPSRARLKRLAYMPLRRAVRTCARAADCVIATDRALEPAVRSHLGVPAERVRVIPNALDLRTVDAPRHAGRRHTRAPRGGDRRRRGGSAERGPDRGEQGLSGSRGGAGGAARSLRADCRGPLAVGDRRRRAVSRPAGSRRSPPRGSPPGCTSPGEFQMRRFTRGTRRPSSSSTRRSTKAARS